LPGVVPPVSPKKKAVGFATHGLSGNLLLLEFTGNLKTMGDWPWLKGTTKRDPAAGVEY